MITTLAPHQVFVFGSNQQGFHGAGSAGYACRGDHRNTWRQDPWFLAALRSPPHSPLRIGKWARLGVAAGYQEGRDGRSFAIITITRPGLRRSMPLDAIRQQLLALNRFALQHSHLDFLCAPLGIGYSGYTQPDMDAIYRSFTIATNIHLDRTQAHSFS